MTNAISSYRRSEAARKHAWRPRPFFPEPRVLIIPHHGLRRIVREHHGNPRDRQRADATRTDESFGSRVQRLRKARAMSQAEVATMMGVSVPAVCAWELNKSRPKSPRMAELAGILDVSVASLLGEQSPTDLQTLIVNARARIAAAVGTAPDRIRIHIDL